MEGTKGWFERRLKEAEVLCVYSHLSLQSNARDGNKCLLLFTSGYISIILTTWCQCCFCRYHVTDFKMQKRWKEEHFWWIYLYIKKAKCCINLKTVTLWCVVDLYFLCCEQETMEKNKLDHAEEIQRVQKDHSGQLQVNCMWC